MNELKTGPWRLTDLASVEPNGLTVFSCFCCGGGSTMGYKLAGFKSLGGVEIDPDMASIYRHNHNPPMFFNQPIQEFRLRDDLPRELFELDVLDGSPPCSSFSMAGNREQDWGKEKKFREGQADQVLDDLFFHFIALADKLRPKVVVAENVKGLVQGNARGYVKMIFEDFEKAGYDTQLFLLDASKMGVPQRRERVFFIARRRGLGIQPMDMSFTEKPIPLEAAFIGVGRATGSRTYSPKMEREWRLTPRGKNFSAANENGHHFNWLKLDPKRPSKTIVSSSSRIIFRWDVFRSLTEGELIRTQTFPDDYEFLKEWAGYVCGMSVPPFMMQRLATSIAERLLSAPRSQ